MRGLPKLLPLGLAREPAEREPGPGDGPVTVWSDVLHDYEVELKEELRVIEVSPASREMAEFLMRELQAAQEVRADIEWMESFVAEVRRGILRRLAEKLRQRCPGTRVVEALECDEPGLLEEE